MSDYQSIPCAEHERLELAVLRRELLNVTVTAGERLGQYTLRPLDVYTRDGAEWLVAETEPGEEITLRLDWLCF